MATFSLIDRMPTDELATIAHDLGVARPMDHFPSDLIQYLRTRSHDEIRAAGHSVATVERLISRFGRSHRAPGRHYRH